MERQKTQPEVKAKQKAKGNLVKMRRERDEKTADVHPDEVEGYLKNDFRVVP